MMDHQSNLMTPSPQVKSEDFLGEDDMMPLFDSADHASVDPSNLLSTPGGQLRAMSPSDVGTPAPATEATPEASEKKPTKKRKSWGQVLPEPKTNLPPRKRAKTEDEKEQRRVERVLRNRRAAQSSRERKRLETEALATRNKQLEDALLALTQQYQVLEKELKKVKPELGGISTSSDSHVTLSQPLFSYPAPTSQVAEVEQSAQQDITTMSQPTLDLINSLVRQAQQEADGSTPKTVDPATISPALAPIAEEAETEQPVSVTPLDSDLPPPSRPATVTEAVAADSTTRSTQYSAAVLCDLQCQRPVETATALSLTAVSELQSLALHFSTTFFTFLTLAISLRQRQALLISIIRLVTNHPTSTSPQRGTSTCPTLPTTTTATGSCKPLRLRLLRKLLTSNRQLARPLLDATLEVLRSRQSRRQDGAGVQASGCPSIAEDLPSDERLMSLAAAIRLLERRIEMRISKSGSLTSGSLGGFSKGQQGVRWHRRAQSEN